MRRRRAAPAVERVEPVGRLLVGQALPDHLFAHHVRDAEAGGAGAVDDDPLVAGSGSGGPTAENARPGLIAAVPCMSSLNVQTWSAYLFRMRRALVAPKSSQCSIAWGNSVRTAVDEGVDEVVVALVADPGVPGAEVHVVVEELRLSVPMSSTTGSTRRGWMPAAAV